MQLHRKILIITRTTFCNWLDAVALAWVWPQPPTPVEVQYYYDHPPK